MSVRQEGFSLRQLGALGHGRRAQRHQLLIGVSRGRECGGRRERVPLASNCKAGAHQPKNDAFAGKFSQFRGIPESGLGNTGGTNMCSQLKATLVIARVDRCRGTLQSVRHYPRRDAQNQKGRSDNDQAVARGFYCRPGQASSPTLSIGLYAGTGTSKPHASPCLATRSPLGSVKCPARKLGWRWWRRSHPEVRAHGVARRISKLGKN